MSEESLFVGEPEPIKLKRKHSAQKMGKKIVRTASSGSGGNAKKRMRNAHWGIYKASGGLVKQMPWKRSPY